MSDPRNKQIKIQTGVVKRITKEKLMYEKEVKLTEDRIQRMKDEGKDEYDIKKMGEVLQESEMMVPETLKRLQTAWEDLKNKLEVF
jgi:tubulin-specific chaperone A